MVGKIAGIAGQVRGVVKESLDRRVAGDPGALALRVGGAAGLGALGAVAAENGAMAACAVAVAAGVALAADVPARIARHHKARLH